MAPKLIDHVTPPPGPDAARGGASTERVITIPQPTPGIPPTPRPVPAQPVEPDPHSQPARQPNGGAR